MSSIQPIQVSGKAAPVRYNDFWVKIIGCLLASEIIDSVGREESIFRRITSPLFYTDLLGGFIIALILWELVRFITRRLDVRYDWLADSAKRICLQVLFGIVVPSFLSFVLTLLFMQLAYNQDIFQTQWLTNEFYAVVLIIVLINLIYFSWWLLLRSRTIHQPETVQAPIINNRTGSEETNVKPAPPVIQVSKGDKTILLSHDEIAFVYIDGSYSFIKTRNAETFVTTYTLDELSRLLSSYGFFRANRQTIVSRTACRSYQSIENGKINIDLQPESRVPVVVSQKRARDFRRWITGLETPKLST